MSKLNPLYMLLFFVGVALLMIYKVGSTQNEIIRLSQVNVENETFGKEIALLKGRWKNTNSSVRKIEAIMSHKTFKSHIVKKEKTRNIYVIALENLDGKTLDSFTNKLLNESISVKKLSLERFSDSNATLNVECEL